MKKIFKLTVFLLIMISIIFPYFNMLSGDEVNNVSAADCVNTTYYMEKDWIQYRDFIDKEFTGTTLLSDTGIFSYTNMLGTAGYPDNSKYSVLVGSESYSVMDGEHRFFQFRTTDVNIKVWEFSFDIELYDSATQQYIPLVIWLNGYKPSGEDITEHKDHEVYTTIDGKAGLRSYNLNGKEINSIIIVPQSLTWKDSYVWKISHFQVDRYAAFDETGNWLTTKPSYDTTTRIETECLSTGTFTPSETDWAKSALTVYSPSWAEFNYSQYDSYEEQTVSWDMCRGNYNPAYSTSRAKACLQEVDGGDGISYGSKVTSVTGSKTMLTNKFTISNGVTGQYELVAVHWTNSSSDSYGSRISDSEDTGWCTHVTGSSNHCYKYSNHHDNSRYNVWTVNLFTWKAVPDAEKALSKVVYTVTNSCANGNSASCTTDTKTYTETASLEKKNFNFNTNGKYTIKAVLTDKGGRTATVTGGPFLVDKTNPTIKIATNAPTSVSGIWMSGDITTTVTMSDALSGFKSGTIKIYNELSGNTTNVSNVATSTVVPISSSTGKYMINTSATDKAGNTTYLSSGPYMVDKTIPILGLSSSQTDGVLTSDNIKIYYVGSDGESGTAYYILPDGSKVDVSGSAKVWRKSTKNNYTDMGRDISVQHSAAWLGSNTSGIEQENWELKNVVENANGTFTVIRQQDNKQATLKYTPYYWDTSSSNALTSSSDTNWCSVATGGSAPCYKHSGTSTNSRLNSWDVVVEVALAGENIMEYEVSKNGTYTFQVCDGAYPTPNCKSGSIVIDEIDKTAPSITYVPNEVAWTNKNTEVTVNMSDSAAGIKKYEATVTHQQEDGTASYKSYSDEFTTAVATAEQKITLSSTGIYTISTSVVDAVNNTATKVSGTYYIDKVLPTIEFEYSNDAGELWSSESVVVTVKMADTLSGLHTVTLPDGTKKTFNGAASGEATFIVDDFGEENKVIVTDVAGNSTTSFANPLIDKYDPTLNLSSSEMDGVWTKDAEIYYTADDEHSGVAFFILPDGTKINFTEGNVDWTKIIELDSKYSVVCGDEDARFEILAPINTTFSTPYVTNKNTIMVNGTYSSSMIGGTVSWHEEKELVPGYNEFTFEPVDCDDKPQFSEKVYIYYDNNAPLLNITSHDETDENNRLNVEGIDEITISGEVSDDLDITKLSVNGKTLIVDEQGKWSVTLEVYDGENEYLFTAIDVAGNITQKSLYTERAYRVYQIIYNADGGSMPTGYTSEYTAEFGVELPKPTKQGYDFIGWVESSDSDATSFVSLEAGTTGDKDLLAKYVLTNYKLIYSLNGGAAINPETYTINTPTFTLNNPTREGYIFNGWSGDNGANPEMSVTISKGSFGEKTFVANWTPITYTIVYDANGGSGTMSDTVAAYDTNVRLRQLGYSYFGHTFQGWSRSLSGSIEFGNGDTVTNLSANEGETIRLYAIWGINEYTYNIKYQSNSGITLGTDTITNKFGESVVVSPKEFEGYKTPMEEVVEWNSTSKTITFNYHPITYSIIYNLDGGSLKTDNPTNYNVETDSFTLYNPTKTGYTFLGWTGSNGDSSSASVSITKGSIGDRSYVANWVENKVEVIYHSNGATSILWKGNAIDENYLMTQIAENFEYSVVDDSGLLNGNNDDALKMTKTGYTWGKYWQYGDENGNLTNIKISQSGALSGQSLAELVGLSIDDSNKTIHLYATWIANTYTVKFNANGGSGTMADVSHTYDVVKALPTNAFTRNSYTFQGWSTTKNGTVAYADGKQVVNLTSDVDGAVTLYAVWKPIEYSISYTLNSGTNHASNPTKYTIESGAITLQAPTRSGYEFTGWTGSNGTTPQLSVTIAAGSSGNKSYTANWEKTWTQKTGAFMAMTSNSTPSPKSIGPENSYGVYSISSSNYWYAFDNSASNGLTLWAQKESGSTQNGYVGIRLNFGKTIRVQSLYLSSGNSFGDREIHLVKNNSRIWSIYNDDVKTSAFTVTDGVNGWVEADGIDICVRATGQGNQSQLEVYYLEITKWLEQ